MTALPNLAPVLPEIVMAVAGMLLLMFGVLRERDTTHAVTGATIVVMIVAGLLILRMHGVSASTFGNLFIVNGFTSFAKLLTLGGAALTLIMINSWAQSAGV